MNVTIDQILRAAQLLEQSQNLPLIDPLSFCKLGQDYEERYTQSKMRSNLITTTTTTAFDNSIGGGLSTAAAAGSLFEAKLSVGSTGSSRRSSPSSLLSGGSSEPSVSSQHSSAPNSPPVVLLPSNINAAAAAVAAAKKLSNASSTGIAPLLTCRSAANPNGAHSTRQSRAAHNELEKNRRANLRGYLDKLKSVLPPDPESTRDTTLSLLTRARNYIRLMKRQKQTMLAVRNEALADNLRLQERLAALKNQQGVIVEPQQPSTVDTQQLLNGQIHDDAPMVQVPTQQQSVPQIDVQTSIQMPTQPSQLLIKPEPQHVSHSSPMYMEFSPSAKPSVVPVPTGLPPSLATLLPQLAAALQQQQTAIANNNAELISSAAALLQNQNNTPLMNNVGLNVTSIAPTQPTSLLSNNLLYTSFRSTPIDLVNDGLLPSLPLLYPYSYLEEQRHQQLLQNPSA
ncbi:Helix-loop-helix DNA-binding domain protein [Aphelenchoides besseyi]|nr:Helix-loop-helix DNA-binding domain protein [Aphelenchoides besseyi]